MGWGITCISSLSVPLQSLSFLKYSVPAKNGPGCHSNYRQKQDGKRPSSLHLGTSLVLQQGADLPSSSAVIHKPWSSASLALEMLDSANHRSRSPELPTALLPLAPQRRWSIGDRRPVGDERIEAERLPTTGALRMQFWPIPSFRGKMETPRLGLAKTRALKQI
jgi:hypothetical protein